MTVPITLNNVTTFQNDTTAATTVNNNSTAITTAFGTALARTGDQMTGNLDMNNSRILNLPAPTSSQEPLRQADLTSGTVQYTGGSNITVSGTTIATTATPTFTTVNGNTITAGTGTLTLGAKTLTASNSLTLAGTDGTTMTFPSVSDAVTTATNTQTLTNKSLSTSQLTGILAAANGGAGTINGALAANGSGLVSQAAMAGISDYVAAGSWTPNDASGAALVFTSVSGEYCRIGNMVFIGGQVIYPTTTNTGNAFIGGLPFNVGTNSGRVGFIVYSNAGGAIKALASVGNNNFSLLNSSNASLTNTNMSSAVVLFFGAYFIA